MQRCDEKVILDLIVEKEIPFDKIEDVFYELYLINPRSSDVAFDELTVYPKSFFHSPHVYQTLITHLEDVLNSDDRFTLQRRFRACLALIYLDGMKENGHFKGYKKFLKAVDNKEAFELALDVFLSENMKKAFSEINQMLAETDSTNVLKVILSI